MTDVKIARALLSVSDKTGLVELGAGAGAARRRAGLDRRHRQGAARRGARGARHLRPDRLSRDDGRAGEDAAPQGPWRPARGARRSRRMPRRWPSTASARSIWSSSISIPFAADGGEGRRRATRSSRISTSAARRWCARRPRTTPIVAIVTDPADYAALIAALDASGGTTSLDLRKRLAAKAFAATAAYDAMIASWFAFADQGERFPDTLPLDRSSAAASCAMARTRTSRPRFYAAGRAARARHRPGRAGPGQGAQLQQLQRCRRRARAGRASSATRAPTVRHRQARQSLRRRHRRDAASRPMRPPSPATPSRPSAASSRSTARSTAPTAEAIAGIFTEVVVAPDADEAAQGGVRARRRICACC